MSGATVNPAAGDAKPQSAFSAVVRKSFSSFSVDSILSGGEPRNARLADEAADSPRGALGGCPGPTHAQEFLLRQERQGNASKKCRGVRSPSPAAGAEDEAEEDVHVETDTEDEKEREASERLLARPVIRPTALGPLQDPRLVGLGHAGPPPPSLLPPHLQAGLWPSLPLLHHQLSLRALASKYLAALPRVPVGRGEGGCPGLCLCLSVPDPRLTPPCVRQRRRSRRGSTGPSR